MKVNRITKNEERLDNINVSIKKLESALLEFEGSIKEIKLLNKYYGSKNWFKDKDDYETGKIPKVKAGVLSEDAVWNMNEDIKDIISDMKEIISDIGGKDDQRAYGDVSPGREIHAGKQRHHGLQHAHQVAGGPIYRQQFAKLEGFLSEIGRSLIELLHLIFLLAECADDPHAGQVFLQNGAHFALGFVG